MLAPIKLALIGPSVGKTCLWQRFAHNEFDEGIFPTLEDLDEAPIRVGDDDLTIEVLDTSGEYAEYVHLHDGWFSSREGFLIVFAVDSASSLEEARMWHKRILQIKGGVKDVPCVLAGLRCDVPDDDREVSEKQSEQLAAQLHCRVIHCSAKTNKNVAEVWKAAAGSVLRSRRLTEPKASGASPMLNEPSSRPRKGSMSKLEMQLFGLISGDSPDDDNDTTERRGLAIRELLSTEVDYVKDLELLMKTFVVPLKQSGDSILPLAEQANMFSNLELIVQINKTLCNDLMMLDQGEAPHGESFSDVLLRFSPYMKMYSMYCEKNALMQPRYSSLVSSHPKFAAFLKEAHRNPALRHLTLRDFLIKPVQRICKYPLLLREVMRHTPASHPGRADLDKAIAMINTVTEAVNLKQREGESMRRVVELQNSMEGMPSEFNLVAPSRRLVREGALKTLTTDISTAIELYYFLFNDVLVQARQSKKGFVFLGVWDLSGLSVTDLRPDAEATRAFGTDAPLLCLNLSDLAFRTTRVVMQTRLDEARVMLAPTEKECDLWLGAILPHAAAAADLVKRSTTGRRSWREHADRVSRSSTELTAIRQKALAEAKKKQETTPPIQEESPTGLFSWTKRGRASTVASSPPMEDLMATMAKQQNLQRRALEAKLKSAEDKIAAVREIAEHGLSSMSVEDREELLRLIAN